MKKLLTCMIIASLCGAMLFAEDFTPDAANAARNQIKNEVSGPLADLAAEIGGALPDNAVVGTPWSDAYIGQLIGIPPHFGVGFSVGATKFSLNSFKTALEAVSGAPGITGFPDSEKLALPTYNVSAKIGGIILPFDLGIRLSYIPQTDEMLWTGLSFNYLLAGLDLRYNLLESGIICPDISVGASFTFLNGMVGYSADKDNGITIDYNSYILELSAQVSKSFIIVTPYVGAGCIMDWTTVDVNARYSKSYSYGGTTATIADDFTESYARDSSALDDDFFTARVFGGLSLNLAVVKIDMCGSYNFMTENWGGNIGCRVQL